jgi:hypothetical protein
MKIKITRSTPQAKRCVGLLEVESHGKVIFTCHTLESERRIPAGEYKGFKTFIRRGGDCIRVDGTYIKAGRFNAKLKDILVGKSISNSEVVQSRIAMDRLLNCLTGDITVVIV